MGGITVTQRFRIAKIVLFRYPRWSSWNSSNDISRTMSDWTETWWEASQWNRDSELLKSFHSNIQDGRHGHLEILQTTFPPNHKSDWAKTWWESSQWHRDSELLQLFFSNIQDGQDGGWPSWNSSKDISSQTVSQIEPKLDGKHRSDMEIWNC